MVAYEFQDKRRDIIHESFRQIRLNPSALDGAALGQTRFLTESHMPPTDIKA